MRYRDYLIKRATTRPNGSIFQDYEDQQNKAIHEQNKAIHESQQYRTGLNSYRPTGRSSPEVEYAEKLVGPYPVNPAVLGPPGKHLGDENPRALSRAYWATRYAPDYRAPRDSEYRSPLVTTYDPKPRQVQSYEYRKVPAANGQGYTRQRVPVTRTDYEPDTSYMRFFGPRPSLPSYTQYVFGPEGRRQVADYNKIFPPTDRTDYKAEMDYIDKLNRLNRRQYPDGPPAWWDEGRHGPWVIPYDEDAMNRAVTKVGPEYVEWLDHALRVDYMHRAANKNDVYSSFAPYIHDARLLHEEWVKAGRPPIEEFDRQREAAGKRPLKPWRD